MPVQQEVSETTLGVRMPVWLKEAIQECAKRQRRSGSNWVRIILEEAVEKELSKKR